MKLGINLLCLTDFVTEDHLPVLRRTGLPGIAAATRVWRPLFPDHETLFTQSAAFIRKTWDEAR